MQTKPSHSRFNLNVNISEINYSLGIGRKSQILCQWCMYNILHLFWAFSILLHFGDRKYDKESTSTDWQQRSSAGIEARMLQLHIEHTKYITKINIGTVY